MRHCFKLLLLTTALMAWFATSAQDAKPQPVTLIEKASAPITVIQTASAQEAAEMGETISPDEATADVKGVGKPILKRINSSVDDDNPAKTASTGPNKAPVRNPYKVTVANGTAINQYVPFDGSKLDYDGSSYSTYKSGYGTIYPVYSAEMLYPSTMLSGLNGKRIRAITFYAPYGIKCNSDGKGAIYVTLGKTETESLTSSSYYVNLTQDDYDNMTYAFPEYNSESVRFEFSKPIKYNSGENLVIEAQVARAGTTANTYFSGISTSYSYQSTYATSFKYNGSWYWSSSPSNNLNGFLPKITFELEDDITLNSEDLLYGDVQCGSNGKTLNLTITNNNAEAVAISELTARGPYADKFSFEAPAEGTTIAAGASLTIPVTFNPGMTTGQMSSSINFTVGQTDFRVALRGNGVKEFAATATPTTVDMGNVKVGESKTATVKFTNTGLGDLTPTVGTPTNEVYTVSGDAGELLSYDSREYTVTFTPTETGDFEGSVTIGDAEHQATVTINLIGHGVNTALPYVVDSRDNPTTTTVNRDVVVCDVSNVSDDYKYPPFSPYAMDYQNHGQMIYPVDELSGLSNGDIINSVTFHANNNFSLSGGEYATTLTLSLGSTNNSSYSNTTFLNCDQYATLSSAGLFTNSLNYVKFDLTNGFVYDGTNLIVDVTIPYNSSAAYAPSTVKWYGKSVSNSSLFYYSSSTSSTTGDQKNFLPKMTMNVTHTEVTHNPYTVRDDVDFGGNDADVYVSKVVTINNPNSSAVNATLTTTEPFYFTNGGSTTTQVTLPAGESTLTLWFKPTDAIVYTGELTISVDDNSGNTALHGVGIKEGEIAVRDSAFFAGITYDWTDYQGVTHKSNLTEVATDPDQIIALLTEVYTNTDIPGNYKRGHTSAGAVEQGYDVTYPGVGTLTHNTGSTYTNASDFTYQPTYGWNIPGTINTDSKAVGSYTVNYAYMDSMQYKPKYEGVTLLLAEMIDDYDRDAFYYDEDGVLYQKQYDTDVYKNLRGYIENTVKSMRVVTSMKRTGEGQAAGTLFKLDVDKLNKFYMLAKGRLRWVSNSYEASTNNGWLGSMTCSTPCYVYNSSLGLDTYVDKYSYWPFRYMFEQFSPVDLEANAGLADVYADLVDMKSFGVQHDCASVSTLNHQFMMYGEDSEASDCHDVRDLMFFVPDYRMMYYNFTKDGVVQCRDNDGNAAEKFLNYHQEHQPTMGLYVIKQDPVKVAGNGAGAHDDYYMLELNWDSNMDDFLPSDEQEYQLWRLNIDEFGVESYEKVYYMNEQGQHTNADGSTTGIDENDPSTWVQVVLQLDPQNPNQLKTYDEVYEARGTSSREVTYAVRGQDTGHFLSLQMSNEESFVIPGKDPAEMVMLSSATYYSRFNADKVKNCYSNKLQMKSAPEMIKSSYLTSNPTMTITRTHNVSVDDGQGGTTAQAVSEVVATVAVNSGNKKMTITITNPVTADEFPNGRSIGTGAGYHANPDLSTWTVDYTVDNKNFANFDFDIWDNFTVDVSKNDHPGRYTYRLEFTPNGSIEGSNSTTAYSNEFNVPVYKTDSKISAARTLSDVLGDSDYKPELAPGDVEFEAEVQLSSKHNILRYDAYRWLEGEDRYILDEVHENDVEQDVAPTGIAANQGDGYSISMNEIGTADYYTGNVGVSTSQTHNWAKFVDYYPNGDDADANAYTYAPVIELFTRGYQVNSDNTVARRDYNTYGGPLQDVAVGKLEIEVVDPDSKHPLMSNYKWWDGKDWYSYYNILLKFNALEIPEGFELYKVRAWRKVDSSILGETLSTRQSRAKADGWYMYEDMNFGDALAEGDNPSKMRLSNLKAEGFELGNRSTKIPTPDGSSVFETDESGWAYGDNQEEAIQGETRATFGAKRLATGANDEFGSLPQLDAEFTVRAYFTRATNPILGSNSGYDPIYVIGNTQNSNGWSSTTPIATLYTTDGSIYTGTLNTLKSNNDYSFFSFTKTLGAWNDIANDRFGPIAAEGASKEMSDADYGQSFELKYWGGSTRAFRVPVGTYNLTVTLVEDGADYTAGSVVINKGAGLRAPRREAAESTLGDDYKYYVAEGTVKFTQQAGSGVVTGLGGIVADRTREVKSVIYVNSLGMQSSQPFSGVNVVVTRYTDGTTTTTKIVR